MKVDLKSYIDLEDHPQPEPVTQAFRRLCITLRQLEESVGWERAMDDYMAEAAGWITNGLLGGMNAAGALFVGHALSAAHRAGGPKGGLRIMGFVIQLSMSEADWAAALKAMAADGVKRGNDDRVLRVGEFPDTVIGFLIKRGERDILREIFRGARFAIDSVAKRAMRDAADFDGWLGDLSMLAAYLTMRRCLPLRIPTLGEDQKGGRIEITKAEDDAIDGGRFVAPPGEENPLLAHLFERREIEMLLRKEAYAAECFAHLFTSVVSGYVTPHHQEKVAAEYARRASESRIDARQWLSLGKNRFEIAPYV